MADASTSKLRVPLDLEYAGPEVLNWGDAMASELASLKSRLQPIVESEVWKGDANFDYVGMQAQWDAASRELFDPKDGVTAIIASALVRAWINYVNSELANRKSWQT